MPRSGTLADALAAKIVPLLKDWAAVTWFRDTEPLARFPRALWNWAILAIWGALTYLTYTAIPLYLAGFAAVAFLYTLARSRRVLAARRAVQTRIIDQTRQQAGHPRSTTSQPVNPHTLVNISRWGRKHLPLRMDISLAASSPAGHSPLAIGQLETIIDKIPNPYTGDGGGWAYTLGSRLRADAVTADDPRLHQQREIAYLRKKFVEWFKVTDKHLKTNSYDLAIPDWVTREHPQKGPIPVPARILFTFDGHSAPADLRDRVERTFDAEVRRTDQEWIYNWTAGKLEIGATAPDSVDVQQKLARRLISDLVAGHTRRSKEPAVATVTSWQDPAHGDPWVPIAFTAELGSNSFTNTTAQRAFEDAADEAFTSTYPHLVWVYEWTTSATTTVEAQAFPTTHIAALRKAETKRLRQVVVDKFGRKGGQCDLTILDWEPADDDTPEAAPSSIQVDFGSQDVSKVDTQETFEAHFDSMFSDRDWNYHWKPEAGHVLLTAVPPLPPFLSFPDTDTPEFERFMALAREGKILFGPRRRGGEVIWDLGQTPHGIFGGQTGAGKSFAMGIPLLAALYQPEYFDVIVCDPKRMDFTWCVEFPNVVRFGATTEEIANCIEFAAEQMDYRQQRCGKRGVRNLEQLRELYVRHPEYEIEDGPCPKRLLFFLDEIAEYMAKSANKEIEEIKAAANALLESLSRLARALEINLITAAQKPARSILGGQLDGQLGFRMCVGPVDSATSMQIMWDNHGTQFPSKGNPKGRAWAYDSKDGYRMLQNPFLPNDTQKAPWDPTITIEGSKDRVRANLVVLGYQGVMVPNAFGGREPRWVLTDASSQRHAAAVVVEASMVDAAIVSPAAGSDTSSSRLVTSANIQALDSDEWDMDWS